jgi:hypothetical protein
MIAYSSRDVRLTLAGYLMASYAIAALAMAPFAGSYDEVLAFGGLAWGVPALIAVVDRKRHALAGRFGRSGLSLIAIVALAWVAGLTFQITY